MRDSRCRVYAEALRALAAEYDSAAAHLLPQRDEFDDGLGTAAGLLNACGRIVMLVGDPNLGLRYARYLNLSRHRVVGDALRRCRTNEQALSLVMDYQNLLCQDVLIRREDTQAGVVIRTETDNSALSRFIEQAFLASIAVSLLPPMSNRGEPMVVLDVRAKQSSPVELGNVTIRYEVHQTALRVDPSWLISEPSRPTTPGRQALQQDWASGTAKVLRENLPNLTDPPIHQILGVTERTLRRRLAAEDTSYQRILDEIRCNIAIALLTETPWPMQDIAELLGFTKATNFHRAFRRWTNRSPGDVRSNKE
ncbi:MAG: helix-turn-helix domain-containing protein [Pseudomonadota bacterium]